MKLHSITYTYKVSHHIQHVLSHYFYKNNSSLPELMNVLRYREQYLKTDINALLYPMVEPHTAELITHEFDFIFNSIPKEFDINNVSMYGDMLIITSKDKKE